MTRAKRIGLMLWPAPGINGGFERGEWAEENGYDDIWLPDGEGMQDPIALAAALGVSTRSIRIGTAVVPVFNRAVPVLASGAVAAEQRAAGRFVLGVGSSTSNMIERWYGLPYAKPLQRVRETIALLRAIFTGEKSDFAGDTIKSKGFKLMERPTAKIPIFIGAMGPRMLELGGEVADGVILNDFTPSDRIPWAIEQIHRGALKAGRNPQDIEIIKRRAVLLNDDVETGFDFYRRLVGFYASAPAYQHVMDRLGYADEIAEIKAGYADRDRARIAGAIHSDMLTRLFAFGDTAACHTAIRADLATSIHGVAISPMAESAEQFAAGAAAFTRSTFAQDS